MAADMVEGDFQFDSANEAATARLAGWLAAVLDAPALIFLNGDLGAGKTAFARGLIRACCGATTQVPSPTFALVQPYAAAQQGAPGILHADLYRLTAPQEIDELGLIDALGTQICLIEWAANGKGVLPAADIEVTLNNGENDDARRIHISAPKPIITALREAAARDEQLQAFLRKTVWDAAQRAPLAGDASTRRYERLHLNGQNAVLMDWQAAPDGPAIYDGQPYSKVAHLAEAMPRFADMVGWLHAAGLAAPMLYALDGTAGFALLEDFGDRTIANNASLDRPAFYYEAMETLLHLHRKTPPSSLPVYDGAVQAVETSLFLDWYLPWRGVTVSDTAKAEWQTLWQTLGDTLIDNERLAETPVAVLRDFHSVNLIWRPKAQGRFRIGLIDVQDALKGHAAYDLASLIYDARTDVAPAQREAALAHYLARRFGDDKKARDRFMAALAICTAQRNLKIAGIFIRLAERDGKPAYLAHLPRIIGYIRTALAAPIVQPVNDWLAAHAPGIVDDTQDAP